MGRSFRFCQFSKKLYPPKRPASNDPSLISERADRGRRKTKAATISAARYIVFIVRPPFHCYVLLLPFRLLEKAVWDISVPKGQGVEERQKEDGRIMKNNLSSLFACFHALYLMPYG